MPRLIALVACLAAGFALFYVSARTPPPLAAGAPAGVFSAGRAMADITVMASAAHPIGSAAHARVRDYLIGRMTALGLAPQIQRDQSLRARAFKGETWASGADIENVIGVLPGRDPALPALTLMAHYDSVPGSPGAADDTAGVAAILEIVRAIKAAGVPARDVMAVITDGEEAGLLGAQAFFADHPLAAHAGFVLNLEARGGGGRAAMFETGVNNGGAIDLFGATAARPSSTSLSVFVYKLLPNDTDFTVAKARGLAGLNYAFIGRQFDYHSPSSTVATLDRGSVQHLGDEVLGTAKALAFSTALPARSPDRVYADLLGAMVVAYPPWVGWPILILAAALVALGAWRARREGAFSWLDTLNGFGAALLLTLGAALALHLTRHATGTGFGFTEQRPLLARFALFEAAMALSGLGAVLLVAAFLGGAKARLAGTWTGLLLSALAVALALQIGAPTIAFVVAWPLLAAGALSALSAAGSSARRAGLGFGLVLTAFTLAWLGNFFHTLLQGLDVPEAPALALWLAAMVLWPLAWPAPRAGARRF
ncbi:MAG: M20/M25/M40 family metallo-hydrolase, partial [Caulobacteraceae bacterium]|nr:M20/M25/M40 family metallo-hydrolase [Caulobacteraceae bacterium]